MKKRSKRIIVSLAVLVGLTGLGMGMTYGNIHADDPMYESNYFDNNSYGSTAGQYVKDYSGTQPHDNEAASFTNHEESGPTSNEMSSPIQQRVIDHTKDPVDLLLVFYYYDKTAPSDTSQFCDAQHNIYNKGDTVDINDLFTSIGHGHGYGYAQSSDPVIGNYSNFVINDNKTMYVPVQGKQNVASIELSLSNGLTNDIDDLVPGQQFNVTKYLQGKGYTDANSDDIITVPSHFYDNNVFPVTLASASTPEENNENYNNNDENNSNTNDNSSNGSMSANISFVENGNYVKNVFAQVDSNSKVNLSDIAKEYGYIPVKKNNIVNTPYSPYDSADYNIDVLSPTSDTNNSSENNSGSTNNGLKNSNNDSNAITDTSNDNSNNDSNVAANTSNDSSNDNIINNITSNSDNTPHQTGAKRHNRKHINIRNKRTMDKSKKHIIKKRTRKVRKSITKKYNNLFGYVQWLNHYNYTHKVNWHSYRATHIYKYLRGLTRKQANYIKRLAKRANSVKHVIRGHYYRYVNGHWRHYKTGHFNKHWKWIPNKKE